MSDITVGSPTFIHLVYVDNTALLLPLAMDATMSLKNFSESTSHLGLNISWPKTKLQNGLLVPALNQQIFQWTVILWNQSTAFICLPWQFTIIGWSVLSIRNAPYRPHLWSHDISKTQMWSVQAPDTHHQAAYQTLVLCMLCLNLTLS